MTQIHLGEGHELTKEGKSGREFIVIVIVSGKAVVRKKGRKVAELGPGDFVGELSMLTGAPRNATVTASTALEVETLNYRELMSLLDESPKVMKKILLTAIARLSEVDKGHSI